MFLDRLRARKAERRAARGLYDTAVAQARESAFYVSMGAPDTPEGRFEILTLHVILLIDRLAGEGRGAAGLTQALFDTYVSDLDAALREMGVGDLAVGKRMRKLGQAFYGRASAYQGAFKALPDVAKLEGIVARTALEGAAGADPAPLAAYVVRCRTHLAACQADAVFDGRPIWPTA